MPFISIQSTFQPPFTLPFFEENDYVLTSAYYSAASAGMSEVGTYNFGDAIFLSADGNTLFVHVSDSVGEGSIEVYRLQTGTWVLQDTLIPPAPSTKFGGFAQHGYDTSSSLTNFSSSSDGNYLVVIDQVAPGVHIYHYDGISWALQQTVLSDPSIPEPLYTSAFNTGITNAALQTGISADGSRMFITNLYKVESPHPYGSLSYERWGAASFADEYRQVPSPFTLTFDRVGSTWTYSGVIRRPILDQTYPAPFATAMSGDGNLIAIETSPSYINYDEWDAYFRGPKHIIAIYARGTGDAWDLLDTVSPYAEIAPKAQMQFSHTGSTLIHSSYAAVPDSATRALGEDVGNYNVVTVFEREGNAWICRANLHSNDGQDEPSTTSLSSDGNTIVVTFPYGYFPFNAPAGGRSPSNLGDNEKPGRIEVYRKITGTYDWDLYRTISHPMTFEKESMFGWAAVASADGTRIAVVDRAAPLSTDLTSVPTYKNQCALICVYDLLTVREPLLPYLQPTHTNRDAISTLNDGFGNSVTISKDGNTMAVTKLASPALQIYVKQGPDWVLQATLTSPVEGADSIAGQPDLSTNGNTLIIMSSTGGIYTPVAFERVSGVWNSGSTIDIGCEATLVYDLSDNGERLAIKGVTEGPSRILICRKIDATTWNLMFSFQAGTAPVDTFVSTDIDAVAALSLTENAATLLISGCDFNGDIQYATVFEDTSIGTDGSAWTLRHYLNNVLFSYYTNKQFGRLGKISSDGSTIAIVDGIVFDDVWYPEWRGSNCIMIFKLDKDGRWIVNDLLYPDVSVGTAQINSIDISADGSVLFASTDSNGDVAVRGGNIHTWIYTSIYPGSPVKKWFKGRRATITSPLANVDDRFARSIACSGDGITVVASAGYLDDGVITDAGAVMVYNRQEQSSAVGARRWKILNTIQPPTFVESTTETLWGKHLSITSDGQRAAVVSSRNPPFYGVCYLLYLLKNDLLQTFPLNDEQIYPSGLYGIGISGDSNNFTLAFAGLDDLAASVLNIFDPVEYQRPRNPTIFAPPANTEYRHVTVSGDGATVFATVYDTVELAYTSVHMYTRDTGGWNLFETITPDPITYATGGGFGTSLSSSYDGRTLVVGAANGTPTNSSLVFIYKWDGASMAEVFNSGPPNIGSPVAPSSMYGTSVSINSAGTRAVIGDPERSEAYVYDLSGATWSLTTTLSPSSDYAGIDLSPNKIGDAVAISGDGNYIVVGGPNATGGQGAINGLAAVYRFSANAWGLEDMLFNDMLDPHPSSFGAGVAVNHDGSIIYVGAPTQDIGLNWYNPGNNGLIYVWANKTIPGLKAGPVQERWPFPEVRPYVTKRLANVDEEFEFKIDVKNPTDVTLTNVHISFLTTTDYMRTDLPSSNNLYDIVDTLSTGSVANIPTNPSGFIWTIPVLSPGQTHTLTRAAKQSNTAYGESITIFITDVTSDQLPRSTAAPSVWGEASRIHANVLNGNTATNSTIAPTTVAIMSKTSFYTLCRSQQLGAGFGMQNAWTNDYQNILIEHPSSALSPYYFSYYSSTGAAEDGYQRHDWPWGDPRRYRRQVAVAPNGKFVFMSNYFDGKAAVFKRDLVGTLKPHANYQTPFPNPAEETGLNTVVHVAISPDAAAKYMVVCENLATNGFKLYRKSPTAFTWEQMTPPTGYVDTDIPTHASWSEDGTYLALSTLGGTRPFYLWKLDWNTETWTDLSFATEINGLSRGSVVKFSKDVNNKILLFVAPAWETDNFNASSVPAANQPAMNNTDDTISLLVKYPTGSRVVYEKLNRPNTITGFTDGGEYYIRQISFGSYSATYAFYNTYNDAINDTNRINLTAPTSNASGFHRMSPVGTGKTCMYMLDKSDDSIIEIPFVVCLKENQTQADYDGSGNNGTFAPGTGYAANTVITLQEGTRVTINTVGGSGEVLTFAIEDRDESKRGHRAGVMLPAINGSGTGFSLTPGTNNEKEHGGRGSFVDATWSDNYLVLARYTISRPPRSIDDSAYIEIFHRSGTNGEVFDHFTGTVSDGYPVASTYRGKWTNAAITSGTATITSASGDFISKGVVVGDRVYLKSGNNIGTYTVTGVAAGTLTVQGIGGPGAFIEPTENNELEIRWDATWPGTASALTMSVVSQGTAWGEPRSVAFNHDGTILAIGGKSNFLTYTPLVYRFPSAPNRVYRVDGTTFTRLTTGRPEERGPGTPNTSWNITNTTYRRSWWEGYPNVIDVWPGYLSGPYYNSTDWDVE